MECVKGREAGQQRQHKACHLLSPFVTRLSESLLTSRPRLHTIEEIPQWPPRDRNPCAAEHKHLPLENRSERVQHLPRAGCRAAQHLLGQAEGGPMGGERQ
jgi:hypothetical protein